MRHSSPLDQKSPHKTPASTHRRGAERREGHGEVVHRLYETRQRGRKMATTVIIRARLNTVSANGRGCAQSIVPLYESGRTPQSIIGTSRLQIIPQRYRKTGHSCIAPTPYQGLIISSGYQDLIANAENVTLTSSYQSVPTISYGIYDWQHYQLGACSHVSDE